MFLKLIVLGYLAKYAWAILSNPLYLALWTLFSLAPPLVALHRTKHLKVNPELEARYDAFVRKDLGKRNFSLICMISFLSFLPRYIIAGCAILVYCSLIMVIMIGTHEGKPMEPWRYNLVSLTLRPFTRLHMWMSGIIKVNY